MRCDGSCTDRDGSCMAFWQDAGYWLCGCEGCTMVVETVDGINNYVRTDEEDENYNKIAKSIFLDKALALQVKESSELNFPGEESFVTEADFYFSENKILVQYNYQTEYNNNGTFSVSFYRNGPEIRYICTGTCEESNPACKEAYSPDGKGGTFFCPCSGCDGTEVDNDYRPQILKDF